MAKKAAAAPAAATPNGPGVLTPGSMPFFIASTITCVAYLSDWSGQLGITGTEGLVPFILPEFAAPMIGLAAAVVLKQVWEI